MNCPECHFDNPSDSKFCKECGTQLIPSEEASISPTKTLETPTEELTRGTTFAGRYEIIEKLGKGGMGKVYRAEDKKIKEEVALKLIKPEIASDKKTIERFSNELKMACKIAHRNVCRMYDLGEEKGTHYITMEYVPGEDLKELTSLGGASHILQGYYTRAGDNFRINITLQKADTGEILGSENAEGPGERSFFPMVDELIRKVKANFQLSSEQLASDLEKEVQKITTSSPEAYKYYVESRKYHYNIEFQKSILLLEKATALDPEFAMAYRALAAAYYNLGDFAKDRIFREKTLDLSNRLSDKERLFIEGEFYFWNAPEKNWDKAIEAFSKLLELYPDDSMVNYELGYIYRALEEWDKSIQYYEVCRKNKYMFLALYASLADVYRAKGFYDKADEVLEYCLENISDSAMAHLLMADNYLAQAKLDLALAEVDKAITRDPTYPWNSIRNTRILMLKRDLAKARLELMKLQDERETDLLYENYLGLFALDLLEGKFKKAKTELGQAIEYLGNALELLPYGPLEKDASFIDSLALAYYKSGDLGKARETYEKVTSLTLGTFSYPYFRDSSLTLGKSLYGDIFAKSFYMLGKIYEQKGQKEKAIENYTKFLDLWKEADLGLPEVEDAKKRLTALQPLN